MGRLSNHPNIVSVYAGGLTDGGLPYLVMPYVPGGSLHERLRREGRLPAAEVIELGSKLAGALAAAHAVGVLHRDVKPDNVLLSPYGEPQLTDFGIARLLDTTTTATGTVHATIRYAAPEVLSGQPATEASDVYGLGATLYACLAGAAPFADTDEGSIVALVGRIASESPADLREHNVPDALASVIERALAKRSTERIGTADELRRLLEAAADAPTADSPAAGDATAAVVAAPTVATPAVTRPAGDHERTAAVPVFESARETTPVAACPSRTTIAARRDPEPSEREHRTAARSWGLLVGLTVLVAGLAALLIVVTRETDPRSDAPAPGASAPAEDPTADADDGQAVDPTPPATSAEGDVAAALADRALAYFDAIRDRRFAASYSMLSPEFRRLQSQSDYERFWRRQSPVRIVGDVVVNEEVLRATVPITTAGGREDYTLTFTRGEDGTWYVDGPRPG